MAGIPCVDEARARVPLFHDAFPTRMGAVPTAVLAERDRARSGHPQASVAAIGAAAKDITGYQPFAYALGAESPFRRLYELDARILLLGVGHNRNSFLRGSGSKRRTSATTTTRTSRASGPSGPNAAWLGVRSSAPPAARWWRPCRSSTSRGGSENSCGSEPGTRECPRPSWVPPWCRPPALKEDR
ncbi:AAC(3) family N-acetyltransferase [Lentzea sp. BCCO 10_0856]|uniref:Aminoglycoside N(3)-acetyltransferase n=1 Tax=Lentzea miocenica TaxID=3095431 RepID=A0ABU4T7R9_9PSEU|nr:AAC(3) family N-acetyltransferase [Lentzea sp. BCCO 10_0856]MDX8034216.1 AAC(3) family N-acetyltransferase [Lentzea sp. BCCO 10_0856]